MTKAYSEHKGKVVDKGKFSHIMAIALNPKNNKEGVVRCIVSREGDVKIKGYTDRSVLYKVKSIKGLEKYEFTDELEIKGTDELIETLLDPNYDFIGFEDPDLTADDQGLLHLYFTIPLISKDKSKHFNIITLGHAVGKSLNDLEMTLPVLPIKTDGTTNSKELSLAPKNSKGTRLNLVESRDRVGGTTYSTVRVARAKDFGPIWKFGRTVFHPKTDGFPWCAGHASPGPLMSQEFIDVGENKRIGLMNGREANVVKDGKTIYGVFSVGLFIYDFELGKIEWVSEKPFIIDSEAEIITFASQFVDTGSGEGILYAHVDDSFVRAYTINGAAVKKLLPNIYGK